MNANKLKQKAYWEVYDLIYCHLASGWEGLTERHPIEREKIEELLYEIAREMYKKSHISLNSIYDYKQH